MLQNERSHHSEKPVHRNEDPGQPWINKVNMLKKNVLKKTLKQTVHHTFLCICPFRVSINSYSHQLILCKSVCFFSISQFSSFQFSCSVVSDSLRCHGLQHTRFSCPSPTPRATHVHRVGDAIQPSHLPSSPSPPTLNLSQHQGLFQWVTSLNQVARVLEFQLQHQSFQWIFRTDFL